MPTFSIGILLSLGAAVSWAISPLVWTSATRRVGTFNLMLLRNVVASALLLAVLGLVSAVYGPPRIPTANQWLWIIVSGLAGVAIGDLMCFEAYKIIGARSTTQLAVLTPVAAALLGLLIGEVPTWHTLGGMVLVLSGVAWALSEGNHVEDRPREFGRITLAGIGFAVGSAVCTAIGAVALRVGEQEGKLDPLLTTTARISTSGVVFWVFPIVRGNAGTVLGLLKNRMVLTRVIAGSTMGVLVGMFCFVAALGHAPAALVTTIVATSPLLVLPLVAWKYRSRIRPTVVVALLLALGGVTLITIARARSAHGPQSTPGSTTRPATISSPRSGEEGQGPTPTLPEK